MTYFLFDQASQQLNLLLVAQRSMIIISAFAIALSTFYSTHKKEYYYLKYIIPGLLLYSIILGIKSTVDFHNYFNDIEDDTLDNDDKKLVDSWKQWEYFNYPIIILIILISLIFIKNEIIKK